MVIVLLGIVGVMTVSFVIEPVKAYADQARRTRLTDDADIALRRMGRDIHAAIPNSVRVSNGGTTLTLFQAVGGGRYRAAPPGTADQILAFNSADDKFEVPTGFSLTGALSGNERLVIYNLGTSGADVYEDANVITPVGTSISISGNNVTVDPPFQFAFESPRQRVYLTSGMVTYQCSGGTLTRDGVIVTRNVSACAFNYTAGSASRHAVATLQLSLTREGESVTLLRQVHVVNLP